MIRLQPNPLAPFLDTTGFVVLDGGLATELEHRGADLRDPLWSALLLLEDPDLIRSVHETYYAAGADVAVTASYQASVMGFARRGIDPGEARRLIARSVELAQDARERFQAAAEGAPERPAPLVVGSIGPYGAALADGSEYRGGYQLSTQSLADFHGPRLEALLGARPDLLAIETFPSPDEAVVVLDLLTAFPAAGAWVSFSCRDGTSVGDGHPLRDAVAAVAARPQVLAVGVNCVAPHLAEPLLRIAASVTAKPLVVYPNSGEQWDAARRRWGTAGAGAEPGRFDFGAAAPRWHQVGARLIGGCCRTTPDTVRAIRATLSTRVRPRGPRFA